MSHKCTAFWGAHARSLTKALAKRTLAERKRWRELQQGGKDAQGDDKVGRSVPFEGWVHRAARRIDYESLATLYGELLLALKQPSDAPNKWRATSYDTGLEHVPSSSFGTAARSVLKGLAKCGKHGDDGHPYHRVGKVPRYGTPNWLEKPVENASGAELGAARDLLRALRDAFAR